MDSEVNNNFNTNISYTTSPTSKKLKISFILLLTFILIIGLFGTYFWYDYSRNLKNLRIEETRAYIMLKCLDYCDYYFDSMQGGYCYEKCFSVNIDNFSEREKKQFGGYTLEFKEKYGIFQENYLDLSCTKLIGNLSFKECVTQKLDLYSSYFLDLEFKEIDKNRVGIEILNYTCLDYGINVQIKVNEENGIDGFEGIIDLEGDSSMTSRVYEHLNEGEIYDYKIRYDESMNIENKSLKFAIYFFKNEVSSGGSEFFECK